MEDVRLIGRHANAWEAYLGNMYLGCFATKEEASAALDKAIENTRSAAPHRTAPRDPHPG